MKRILFASFAGLVFLLSLGDLQARSYRSSLREWTEKGADYNLGNFEARLVWRATYLSREFRTARVAEEAQLYKMKKVEEAALLDQELREASGHDEFIAAIYLGSGTNSELGRDTSLWRFTLLLPDGREVAPESFESLKQDEKNRYFYPYTDKWSRLFLIRFPKAIPEGKGEFALRLISPAASDQIRWKLK